MGVDGKSSTGKKIRSLNIRYFFMIDQVEKYMYRSNVFQQMRYGETSLKSQRKEKRFVTLKTAHLVEMDKVELVSEGRGKKTVGWP